jgi:hypothetical protein
MPMPTGIYILGDRTSSPAGMEVRMAQHVNVKFVDDLDGSDARKDGVVRPRRPCV